MFSTEKQLIDLFLEKGDLVKSNVSIVKELDLLYGSGGTDCNDALDNGICATEIRVKQHSLLDNEDLRMKVVINDEEYVILKGNNELALTLRDFLMKQVGEVVKKQVG